ncbi:DUF551 domain-containing protein [Enterobacter hormaechei]
MAEFTKEEQIQAIYDLKVGYTLGHADIEMLKAMARQLLAGLEQGPVAYIGVKMLNDMQDECRKTGRVWISDTGLGDCVPLYAAPQLPQPAVPDMATVETTYPDVQTNWQDAKMYAEGWNACRAAMLQSFGNSEQLNSPVIQDGWVACVERMPSAGEQVLAYRPDAPESNDPLIKMATYVGGSAHGHGFDCYCKPTHWMPLPAAPQQED